MGTTRTRWLIAIAATVALGIAGATVTMIQLHHPAKPVAAVDNPAVQAPDADADAATVDLDAKGSPPSAFTVAGRSVFIDTRKLTSTSPVKKAPRAEAELVDRAVHTGGGAGALQTATAALVPSPTINALGLDFNTWGDGHPPDTNGVVGPNHFVQSVNTSVGIFSKSTGALISAFTFNSFFVNSGTTQCDTSNQGDPTVTYDAPSGKWVVADFTWTSLTRGPYWECIAVSSGSDPVASTWTFYSVPAGNGSLPDYPKFGSGPDAVYFTSNNFRRANHYVGSQVYAIRRSTLGTASLQVQTATTSSSFFSLLPANIEDPPPPPASPTETIASVWSGQLSLWRFTPDWNNVNNTTFVNNANLAVSYSSVGSIPTPGESVDSLSPRAMNKAQLRNGSLWLTQTVAAGGTAGIRWYEVTNLTGTPSIHQNSTFAPADGQYRWMPSLAVDKQGNMMVGYNSGNGGTNPAIRYAGRLVGDPVNQLSQGEATLIAGAGAPSSGNFGRWGDYSEMSVDPVDGCTFWFTGEYYAVTGADWQTRIGAFKFPGCV